LVTSTTALIGRIPAASRRRCIQAGDGPLRTPSNQRAVKRGLHRLAQAFRIAAIVLF